MRSKRLINYVFRDILIFFKVYEIKWNVTSFFKLNSIQKIIVWIKNYNSNNLIKLLLYEEPEIFGYLLLLSITECWKYPAQIKQRFLGKYVVPDRKYSDRQQDLKALKTLYISNSVYTKCMINVVLQCGYKYEFSNIV